MATKQPAFTPPKHLSKESAEFFRKTIAGYDLDEHHILLLVKALEAFDLAEKCRKILDKEGLTYTDRFNSPRARPETKILNDSRNLPLFGDLDHVHSGEYRGDRHDRHFRAAFSLRSCLRINPVTRPKLLAPRKSRRWVEISDGSFARSRRRGRPMNAAFISGSC